jgi:hypothetical protein
MEHVSFWSADGVDDSGDLIGRIVDSRVAVGITGGIGRTTCSATPSNRPH